MLTPTPTPFKISRIAQNLLSTRDFFKFTHFCIWCNDLLLSMLCTTRNNSKYFVKFILKLTNKRYNYFKEGGFFNKILFRIEADSTYIASATWQLYCQPWMQGNVASRNNFKIVLVVQRTWWLQFNNKRTTNVFFLFLVFGRAKSTFHRKLCIIQPLCRIKVLSDWENVRLAYCWAQKKSRKKKFQGSCY